MAKTAPTRKAQPGDLVCGECGENNPPNRKFCSRCGTSLVEAAIVKTPWWRKIFPKKKAKVLAAGARPGKEGVKSKNRIRQVLAKVFPTLRKVVALLVLIGGILFSVYPPFRHFVADKYNAVYAKAKGIVTEEYQPVNAGGRVTTPGILSVPNHPGQLAFDGFTNTYWAATFGPKAKQPVLQVPFQGDVDLDRALIRNGIAGNFQGSARPQTLHLVYLDASGKAKATADVTLKDTPDAQEVKLENAHGIRAVQIFVTSVYQAVGSDQVAITEIELFKKK